jgi:hypothetical protein
MNLFTHRDLWTWLDKPFQGAPTVLLTAQPSWPLANRDSRTREPHLDPGPISSNNPGNRPIRWPDRRELGQQ